MWLWTVLLVLGSLYSSTEAGIAEMISNYAKVAISKGNNDSEVTTAFLNTSFTTPLPVTKADNETEDDEVPDYEDFDDLQEESGAKATSKFDSATALKYLNGVVDFLALLYSFNGRKSSLNPESWHFGASRPREGGRDGFAEDINNLAQDRFHPTTATKKFKLQQGYSSVGAFPPYDAYSKNPADSYSSNGGKTSYDSDATMYMINPPNGDNDMKMPVSVKIPMKDYMAQNDNVDIQQSYSYQVPDQPPEINDLKEKVKAPAYYYDNTFLPTPSPPEKDKNTYGLMMKPLKNNEKHNMMEPGHPWVKEPYEDVPHDDDDDEPRPVYYPWMDSESKKKPKPMDDGHNEPAYYPWMSKPTKKVKPPPPPPTEEDEDHVEPWRIKGKFPITDDITPPLSHGPWAGDDHNYIDDHDHHQFIDDDHHEHDEEEDHQVKDEDRESKRPYTYYHLGRKLWYIPLLFSVYFILYIGSLILKSVARHKVQLPEKLWELHDNEHHHDHHDRRSFRQLDDVTQRVLDGISKKENKFM